MYRVENGLMDSYGGTRLQRLEDHSPLYQQPLAGSIEAEIRATPHKFVGSVGDAFSAICCWQIFRFTSSKPSGTTAQFVGSAGDAFFCRVGCLQIISIYLQ